MIWGFIGVLLAAPLTAIIRITFERFDTTKQIARVLDLDVDPWNDNTSELLSSNDKNIIKKYITKIW